MNFLLTKYIYPIKEKIVLSEKFNYSLDNPRTDKEINYIYNYISKSYDVKYSGEYDDGGPRVPIYNIPEHPDIVTIETSLKRFFKNHDALNNYINEFRKYCKKDSPLKTIAKMWIIARYEDSGLREEIVKEHKNEKNTFFLLSDEHPLVEIPKKLINYSHMLSFLYKSNDDDFSVASFIIQESYHSLQNFKIDTKVNNTILFFMMSAARVEKIHNSDTWFSFHLAEKEIVNISNIIEIIYSNSHEKIFTAVSEILTSIGEVFLQPKHELISLTSILELLLTHNPNFNRFNVEDSISKQFKLKTSLLVYLNDKSICLEATKKRLGEIYSQRSNITHGNYIEYDKLITKEYNKLLSEDPDIEKSFVIEYMNSDLLLYIRAVLEEFIKDPDFVMYLKKN